MAAEQPARRPTVHFQLPPCERWFAIHYRDDKPIGLVIDGEAYGVHPIVRGKGVRDGDQLPRSWRFARPTDPSAVLTEEKRPVCLAGALLLSLYWSWLWFWLLTLLESPGVMLVVGDDPPLELPVVGVVGVGVEWGTTRPGTSSQPSHHTWLRSSSPAQ